MGYNVSNRRFRSDMFPKRGLSNTETSLILMLLLAPVFLVYVIALLIQELSDEFSTSEEKTDRNRSRLYKPSPYSKLITDLSKETRVTKLDYSNIIKSNIKLKQRIEELYCNVDTYKRRARSLGLITKLKKEYIKDIQTAFREIHSLETFNKIPVSVGKPITEIEGCIYLKINTRINVGDYINLDKFAQKKNKIQTPYAINKVPILSLQFTPIELYFFNDALVIITKEDYIVIDSNNILAEYRIITLDVSLANKDQKQFNIVDSKCRHFCKDGSIDLRYVSYRLVKMGVLELNISTQKISLLFSNTKYGYSIYKLLLDN